MVAIGVRTAEDDRDLGGSVGARATDGTPLKVRPLRREDRERYRRAVDGLSATTVLLRFGGPKARLTDAEVDNFLDVGQRGREALVITDAGDHDILGVARFAPLPDEPGSAEVAVVVADEWQGKGLGTLLMDHWFPWAGDAGTCGCRRRAWRTTVSSPGSSPVTASTPPR